MIDCLINVVNATIDFIDGANILDNLYPTKSIGIIFLRN